MGHNTAAANTHRAPYRILPGQGEGAPLLPPLLEPEFGRLGKFAGSLGPVPPVFGAAVPVFAVVDDVADGSFPKSPACAAGTPVYDSLPVSPRPGVGSNGTQPMPVKYTSGHA